MGDANLVQALGQLLTLLDARGTCGLREELRTIEEGACPTRPNTLMID